jgi:hypothetical protein
VDEKTTNSIHLVLNLSENSVALVTKGNGREIGLSVCSLKGFVEHTEEQHQTSLDRIGRSNKMLGLILGRD